jgi:hypothetical protein
MGILEHLRSKSQLDQSQLSSLNKCVRKCTKVNLSSWSSHVKSCFMSGWISWKAIERVTSKRKRKLVPQTRQSQNEVPNPGFLTLTCAWRSKKRWWKDHGDFDILWSSSKSPLIVLLCLLVAQTVFRVPETYHGSPRDFRAWDFSVQFRWGLHLQLARARI